MSVSNEVFILIAVSVFYYIISLKSNEKDFIHIEEIFRFISVSLVPLALASANINIMVILVCWMLVPILAIVSFVNGGIVKIAIRAVREWMGKKKGNINWEE